MQSYEEINEKIKRREAVVVTADQMCEIVAEHGVAHAAAKVDVVTTGTFGAMCSSGLLFNTGHTVPRMKVQHASLGGIPCYGGLAAVDFYLGATEMPPDDPLNKVFPGKFRHGGAHVIEALVRGKDLELTAQAYGTDCYPRTSLQTSIALKDLNNAVLLNPRNGYQNYNVAVNAGSNRPIYTYMGILRPGMANANYSSAGQLSPLLNDPHYRTIGIGTRIFLGGGTGYVYFAGTQHCPNVDRTAGGVPTTGAGTLAVAGDLKGMNAAYLRAVSLVGYGVSLAVGIGVPIPILDEEMARYTAVSDRDILAPVIDYGLDYPNGNARPLAHVSYAELRSGAIEVRGRRIPTASLSSIVKARAIAKELKVWLDEGRFFLGKPVEPLPGAASDVAVHGCAIRR